LIDGFFGKGMGSTHSALGFVNNHMHIGWANYLFKGGIFLLSFYIISGVFILRKFARLNPHDLRFGFVMISLFYLATSLISTNWSQLPSSFLFGVAFFASLNGD